MSPLACMLVSRCGCAASLSSLAPDFRRWRRGIARSKRPASADVPSRRSKRAVHAPRYGTQDCLGAIEQRLPISLGIGTLPQTTGRLLLVFVGSSSLALAGTAFGQKPDVTSAVDQSVSQPARSLGEAVHPFGFVPEVVHPPRLDPQHARGRGGNPDRAARKLPAAPGPVIQPGANFDGIGSDYVPPDPSGAVGMTQYVLSVNASFTVYDKTGKKLKGPVPIKSLWSNSPESPCADDDDGDPIVSYDRLAHRWLITQFLYSDTSNYGECVAVSETEDATGAYYLYHFRQPAFPDYPKVAVWPDGYYVSFNMFPQTGNAFARACALERSKMLTGAPAAQVHQVCFDTDVFNMLPADYEGPVQTGHAIPGLFIRRNGDGKSLGIRRFAVNWQMPENSRFGTGANHATDVSVPVSPFNDACAEDCIPQQGGGAIEALGDRLMYRAVYRRFADHDALFAVQTVEPDNQARGAIRWYELRDPTGSASLYQEGTFEPDLRSRWMGSLGVDGVGDVAIGYSISGPSLAPGLRVAFRRPTDPKGLLTAETPVVDGIAQTNGTRWGDYSQMTTDPADDCTFWYTGEYIRSTPPAQVRDSRIANFRMDGCASRMANRSIIKKTDAARPASERHMPK